MLLLDFYCVLLLCVCRYGVVLKRLDLTKMAVDILVEAVTKQPLHWGAWQELATLITDREMVALRGMQGTS